MPNSQHFTQDPCLCDRPHLITRFSIALMAFTLIGMGVGSALPPTFGVLTLGAGVVGIIAYGVFEALARQRHHDVVEVVRSKSEERLQRHLQHPAENGCDQTQNHDGLLIRDSRSRNGSRDTTTC